MVLGADLHLVKEKDAAFSAWLCTAVSHASVLRFDVLMRAGAWCPTESSQFRPVPLAAELELGSPTMERDLTLPPQ